MNDEKGNTGHRNTGHLNTGLLNTGDFNTGDLNTGYFCVDDGPVTFFDAPCSLTRGKADAAIPWIDLPAWACEWVEASNMSDEQKSANPSYATTGGFLRKHTLTIQQSFPLAWAKLDTGTKQRFLDLPNFDAAKFLKCTGVDVRPSDAAPSAVTDAVPDEITLNGRRYRLCD